MHGLSASRRRSQFVHVGLLMTLLAAPVWPAPGSVAPPVEQGSAAAGSVSPRPRTLREARRREAELRTRIQDLAARAAAAPPGRDRDRLEIQRYLAEGEWRQLRRDQQRMKRRGPPVRRFTPLPPSHPGRAPR